VHPGDEGRGDRRRLRRGARARIRGARRHRVRTARVASKGGSPTASRSSAGWR
jgi:hypothetical protein